LGTIAQIEKGIKMNNRQLQEAIDKTRAWLMPQVNTATTPSLKARDDAVVYLCQLQNVQIQRALMAVTPRVTLGDIK